jgi:beta-galactosidase
LTASYRYDKAGKETARTSLKSAQKETELRLVPEDETTKQGDLLYVRIRYTDQSGTIKPTIRGEIKVTVMNGKLLALGNACSYNEKGYQTDTTDTYYGEALAIVAPDGTGSVTVKAESKHGKTQTTVPVQA